MSTTADSAMATRRPLVGEELGGSGVSRACSARVRPGGSLCSTPDTLVETPDTLVETPATPVATRATPVATPATPHEADGARGVPATTRLSRYPISRWYLCSAAGWMASRLVATRVRPVHLTLLGLGLAMAGAGLVAWRPDFSPLAGLLVLAAWLCDRVDGQLARRQRTVSARGAWLDANVDELTDVVCHLAAAAAASAQCDDSGPWLLVMAFVVGKYLFMYGLNVEEHVAGPPRNTQAGRPHHNAARWLRAAYHLPGNADVRVHLLVAALLTGRLWWELAIVALYYNLRWTARYVLVARRLGGTA